MSGILSSFFGGIVSVAKDTYFNLVTLLLPGNGTNGAQNNTFLDSSTNNFTITRNGNTTQGTFTPFSQTGWSNFFDGSGDFIEFASANTANAMGTGDWTVEAWVYPTANNKSIFDTLGSGAGSTSAIRLRIDSSNQLIYQEYSTVTLSGGTVSLNQWTHVAACRSGTTLRLFVNGSQVASATNTANLTCGTNRPIIGADGFATSDLNFAGYISNVRSVKGQALYTGAFTPSTIPLTTTSQGATASNVSLLTCQSNRFVDNSNGAFVPTISGNTSVQAFSPFAPTAAYSAATVGGSGYFDGSGDYLSIADNSALEPSNGNFTIECWFYSTTTGRRDLFDKRTSDAINGYVLVLEATNGYLTFYADGLSAWNILASSTAPPLNQWNHVAVVRNGSSWAMYLNGVSIATATNSGTITDTTASFSISSPYRNYTGYITNLRFIKGQALTTGNFTPPTAPVTTSAVGWTGANVASSITGTVSLLTNFTNAGITDATAKNVLETVGNAQISTTQSKFGGGSLYFDGTGDSCYIPDTPNLKFGTGDLTIECWVYPTATPGGQGAQIIGRHEYGSNAEWIFQITSTSKLNIYLGASNVATSTGSISNNQWTHIACTRSGSSVRLFINGTIDGTGTYSGSSENGMSGAYTIGSDQAGDEAMYTGYIDDLRVTKGYARYTANFTIPSSAYPLQ